MRSTQYYSYPSSTIFFELEFQYQLIRELGIHNSYNEIKYPLKLGKYVLLNEYYWWNYTSTIPLTCLHSMFCFCIPRSQHGTSWRDTGRTSIPGVIRQCDGRQLRWRAWPGQHMKTSRLTIHLIHIHVKNETLLDDSPFLRIQLHCMLSYWYFLYLYVMYDHICFGASR